MKNKLQGHKENLTYNASPEIFERAKALKRSMTKAEKILWHELRDSKLKHKFRRQHPIDKFIVDFYCHELNLVIELDGDVHDLEEVKERDEGREEMLKEYGLKVLRFKNDDVFERLNWVMREIKNSLGL